MKTLKQNIDNETLDLSNVSNETFFANIFRDGVNVSNGKLIIQK